MQIRYQYIFFFVGLSEARDTQRPRARRPRIPYIGYAFTMNVDKSDA